MILFQEVVDEMYTRLKQLLPDWGVYRRHDSATMPYYLVTAVRCPRQCEEDGAGSRRFQESRQFRHSLSVRRAGVAFINVHAESGPSLTAVTTRREQIASFARAHEETGGSISTILAGDFNARLGEDDSLLNDGWTDACSSADDWTWRQGSNRARRTTVSTTAPMSSNAAAPHSNTIRV